MKLKKVIIMALCLSLVMTCGVFLAACNKGGGEGGGDTYVPRNSNQWFTEAELAKKVCPHFLLPRDSAAI